LSLRSWSSVDHGEEGAAMPRRPSRQVANGVMRLIGDLDGRGASGAPR
jgi:hypothetical protein